MPRVYAKARNNDPAVPYNSREKHFKSGRGFAVDIQVRDYNGSAAQRYAEGLIIGFWESETEARRVADEVNNGTRYDPGHHLHSRAHNAIVVPAWNGPDVPDDILLWETPEGSALMVAAYESAGVPIPRWLSNILDRLDNGPKAATYFDREAPVRSHSHGKGASQSRRSAVPQTSASVSSSDLSTVFLDDELAEMISNAVQAGDVITTLGTAQRNRIVSIDSSGIRVATEKSERRGTGPQLVPAWMIAVAWGYLQQQGSLT